MIRWVSFFLILGVAYTFVEPEYQGLVDMRYLKSRFVYQGLGTFAVSDYQLDLKLPLNKNTLVFSETHLTTAYGQIASQIYVDMDGFFFPGNVQIGRFRIPFGLEKSYQWDRRFIISSLLTDEQWVSGAYLMPREENGVRYYYRSRAFSTSVFLVNGKGDYVQTLNPSQGKSFGGTFRGIVKDFLDIGVSLYYNNLSDLIWTNSTQQYFLGEMDGHFRWLALDATGGVLCVTGQRNGVGTSALGLSGEAVIQWEPNISFGSQASMMRWSGGSNDYRLLFISTYQFRPDTMLRGEGSIESSSGVLNYQVQLQMLVRI